MSYYLLNSFVAIETKTNISIIGNSNLSIEGTNVAVFLMSKEGYDVIGRIASIEGK